MKCSECHIENPDDNKFCRECGTTLLSVCSQCGNELQAGDIFCGKCGQKVVKEAKEETTLLMAEGERKYVTVLFSDLTGYTAMSEKLDPEAVKEITGRIFGETSEIIAKYDGFVEKYAGDAVMALFGVPGAHEDDPIRAIKAAREIHDCVEALSPEIENKIGQPISMHSGINTGLVVTGEVDMARGTHGVAGDTVNVAARLSQLARAGEVLVDSDTFHQAEGYFNFGTLEPTMVKGKSDPVKVHRVLSPRDKPITIRRLSGVRADLVGRKVEMAELSEALEGLHQGNGRIFSISGDAGTGKSRLVEEFKATLDLKEIQWLEGHAYAYAQNIPYFPMIDLLNRVFHIQEGDAVESLKEKVESGISQLVSNHGDVTPYVGGLYALSYPEIEDVSPEFWKSRLQEAIQTILTALAKRAPTVFFLEDLHWADPSFVELLRRACLEIRQAAIVLCVYRPTFNLFKSHQADSLGKRYHEVRLQDLSRSESQAMVQFLLGTEKIPADLQRFVQKKMEGNPFYLEEAINTLIESKTLVRDNRHWRVTKPIGEADISATIQGIISARVDRLEQGSKRILQEASVIGRSFYYEILKKTTELKNKLDQNLNGLERLDLIKTKSIQPDLEYIFKHALTQEVIYKGLLKKDRKAIHERIGLIIEQLFKDRLPEFYETLAFHFGRSRSVLKAVDYLMKSGEKSLARYAVEEAHQYFKKAFELLSPKQGKSNAEKTMLISILNSWGYAFYYLGDVKSFISLYRSHEDLAESLHDKAKIGMFYVWLGIANYLAGIMKDAYECLHKAMELGEASGDQKVVGYACTWLTWTCTELGLYSKGIDFGERAQNIAKSFPSDQYLFFKSFMGLCYISFFKGELQKLFEGAEVLLSYGRRYSNNRSLVFGHWVKSFGYYLTGDMVSAQKCCENAVEVALDPFYSQFPKLTLGFQYLLSGQNQKSEDVLQSAKEFSEKYDLGMMIEVACIFLAPTLIAKGRMNQGFKILAKTRQNLNQNQRKTWYALSEYILGKVFSEIATGPKPDFSVMAKNIGFLVKNAPLAGKKAEEHFNKAIELFKELGAEAFLGSSYLDLGLLFIARKKDNAAMECIFKAIEIFEKQGAEGYLKQAKNALETVNAGTRQIN